MFQECADDIRSTISSSTHKRSRSRSVCDVRLCTCAQQNLHSLRVSRRRFFVLARSKHESGLAFLRPRVYVRCTLYQEPHEIVAPPIGSFEQRGPPLLFGLRINIDPASMRRRPTSTEPPMAPNTSVDQPSRFRPCGFAPRSSNKRTRDGLPITAPAINGVKPSGFATLGSAPLPIRSLTVSKSPRFAAESRAELPAVVLRLGSAPASDNARTRATSPDWEA